MSLPIFKKLQLEPTSGPLKDDPSFAGYPWRVLEATALFKGEQILPRRSLRSTNRSLRYVKVAADLVQSGNLAVAYDDTVMLIPHGHPPDGTTFSRKSAQIYNYYKWIPYAYRFNDEWLSHHEFIRRIMPTRQEPEPETPSMSPQEVFDKRLELMKTGEYVKQKFVCTCGVKHRWSLYKELGEKPPARCPGGGLVTRVIKIKYVCSCPGPKHVREVSSDSCEVPPEKCPAGTPMQKASDHP